MIKKIKVYNSFKQAELADRRERWSMTPIQRLQILESLRKLRYDKNASANRLQRLFEVVDIPEN